MTSRSPTPIDKILSLIPVPVRAALEGEFHLQVKTAYTKDLNNKLVAIQATVPQAALSSLPLIVTEVTPAKTEKPATETSGSNQGKRKAPSDAPPCLRENSTKPIGVFANATIAAAASAAAAIATTTTAAITTKVATTASAGTSLANAFEVPDSDSNDTDNTMPPVCPKKEHGLTIILGMDIKNHLKSIKLDISIVVIKPEPGTSITNYINGIHFLGTVLTITEASEEVINLLPNLKNIGSRKNVRTVDIIGFLKTNGVKLTPLANNYKKIMITDHKSPIIIEYSITRHSFESTDLPPSWIQLCILFQKEKLHIPFNQKGEAISLGNQFNEQKWTHNFSFHGLRNLSASLANRILPWDFSFSHPGIFLFPTHPHLATRSLQRSQFRDPQTRILKCNLSSNHSLSLAA
jgi:hypothetical protein